MAKGHSVTNQKNLRFDPVPDPCAICKEQVFDGAIECDGCKEWVHYQCVPISELESIPWQAEGMCFYCKNCVTDSKGNYDFKAALSRLVQDNKALQEQMLLHLYNVTLPPLISSEFKFTEQEDCASKELLCQLHPVVLHEHTPLYIVGDGNCFYRSLSLGLFGSQAHHLHIRLLTALEIFNFPSQYTEGSREFMQQLHDKRFVIPSYFNLLESVIKESSYADICHLFAASNAIGHRFYSYQPTTGPFDMQGGAYTCVITGHSISQAKSPLCCVMWTVTNPPANAKDFIPNHFVLLVPNNRLENQSIPQNCFNNSGSIELSPNSGSIEISPDKNSSSQLSEFAPSHSSSILPDDSPDKYISNASPPQIKQVSFGKSLTNFMTPEKLFEVICNELPTASVIPKGPKEDIYFLLDNVDNIKQRNKGKKSDFTDDCGVWNSKITSTKTTYFLFCDNQLNFVIKKDSAYGKMIKKVFTPLEP